MSYQKYKETSDCAGWCHNPSTVSVGTGENKTGKTF